MIEGLLTCSRVGTRGGAFERTAVDAILGRVLLNLRLAIKESGATITHDKLPEIVADGRQLVQVF